MSDVLRLESSLTEKEIEENFKDFDFFSGFMDGLQEPRHERRAVKRSGGEQSEAVA